MDAQCFNLVMCFIHYVGEFMSCVWTLKWIGIFPIHFKIMTSLFYREHYNFFLYIFRWKRCAKINELSVGSQYLTVWMKRCEMGRWGVGVLKLTPSAPAFGAVAALGDLQWMMLVAAGYWRSMFLWWVLNTETEFKNQCPSELENTCDFWKRSPLETYQWILRDGASVDADWSLLIASLSLLAWSQLLQKGWGERGGIQNPACAHHGTCKPKEPVNWLCVQL